MQQNKHTLTVEKYTKHFELTFDLLSELTNGVNDVHFTGMRMVYKIHLKEKMLEKLKKNELYEKHSQFAIYSKIEDDAIARYFDFDIDAEDESLRDIVQFYYEQNKNVEEIYDTIENV